MSDEVIRLDRVCRGCLKEEGDMRSLFRIEEAVEQNSPRLNQMLTSSTQIRIMENDGLPCQICVHCANKLFSAYSFKHMCESSDAKLRKYVSQISPTTIIQNCHQNHNATGVKQEANLSSTTGADIIDFNTMFNTELSSIKTEVHDQADTNASQAERENKNMPENPNEKCTQTKLRDIVEIYNCPQCQKVFGNLSGLTEHLSKHSKKKFAPCSACGKIFSSIGHLKVHTVEDHSVRVPEKISSAPLLNCQMCKSSFDDMDQLKKHMSLHGKKKIYNCETCERGFNHSDNYKTHIGQCKGKKYSCEICDLSFSKQEMLKTHNETVHTDKVSPDENASKSKTPILIPLKTEVDSKNESSPSIFKEISIDLPVIVKEEPLDELLEEAEREHRDLNDEDGHDFSDNYDNHAELLNFDENDGGVKSENSDYKPPEFKTKRRVGRPRKDSFSQKKKHKLKHLKLEIGENDSLSVRYPCDVCPKMLTSSLALKIHMAKHTGEDLLFTCMVCGKSFNRAIRLKRHELTHGLAKRYKCNSCDKTFNRQDHLNKHMWQHTENKPHQCDACPRGFMRPEHLERHKAALHSGKEKNPKTTFCPICNRGFTTEKYLETHMRMHTGDKTFTCKVCDKSFNSKWHLKEHNKWHSAEKPFLCSECGQRFIRNDYLVIHMRRHKGEKPYKCKFCGKGFPRATDLTVHERYHTGEKTHLCTICGKGFQRQYNLTVHLRVHTGEKPYVCSYCGKRFAQGNDLKSHVRRHTGERYNCEVCGEGFIQGYHLTQHKRSVHGIDCTSHIRRVEKHPQANPQNQPNHVPPKHRSRTAAHQQDLAAQLAATISAQIQQSGDAFPSTQFPIIGSVNPQLPPQKL